MGKKLTEFELIARLTAGAASEGCDLVRGVGDDCAVIAGPDKRDWLVTADALIEGVHFRREWTDWITLGRKALSVNLSDIAAMGGAPRFYLVSIGLPPEGAADIAEALYAGMRAVATEHGAILVGGDTVASPSGVVISITAIGEAERGSCLYRGGAKAGDAIYATGSFGASALGLKCLERKMSGGEFKRFIDSHNDPAPRVDAGMRIAESKMATAMIDVSDGLVADLSHIADASGVGFEIDASKAARSEDFDRVSRELGLDPLRLALSGGEDYELLFAVAASRVSEFEKYAANVDALSSSARIGTISADAKTRIARDAAGNELRIDSKGFDHFRK